jgi:hypothetical protein
MCEEEMPPSRTGAHHGSSRKWSVRVNQLAHAVDTAVLRVDVDHDEATFATRANRKIGVRPPTPPLSDLQMVAACGA